MNLIKLIALLIAYPFVKLAKLLKRKPKKEESKDISGIGIIGRDITPNFGGGEPQSKESLDYVRVGDAIIPTSIRTHRVNYHVGGKDFKKKIIRMRLDYIYAEIEELKKLRESAKENNDLVAQAQLSHKISEKLIEASKELGMMVK